MQNINSSMPANNPSKPAATSIKNLSTDKDMIFYEYEIVNRETESKWAREQARKYGLCLCSRWLFMIIGNILLITITCSTSAILLYVNTPTDLTYRPLNYTQNCTIGSSNCDTLRNLYCLNGTCTCISNTVWNGSDCTCLTNQYWDGLSCINYQGYQQLCSASLPCFGNSTVSFVCDNYTSTCLCSSYTSSTPYYTKYYTGGTGNLYGGTCLTKTTNGIACSTYGVSSCQEYLGLTCSLGPSSNLICQCLTGYYWNTSSCIPQVTVAGQSCALNPTYACSTTNGLTCSSNTCVCSTNYFYNNFTSVCQSVLGYESQCYANTWCNSNLLLSCNLTPWACNCPTTSVTGMCDCQIGFFWNGQTCTAKVAANQPCPGSYACLSGNSCLYGYCTVVG